MSECVVRIQMPKWCWDCPCVNGEYGYCQADKEERQIEDPNERPSWCPIIAVSPWHRVEDELPEKEGDYLVWTMLYGGHAYTDYYTPKYGCDEYKVIAWMPLPEPPKEDA